MTVMDEDKYEIVKKLLPAIQLTRNGHDVINMEYCGKDFEGHTEAVRIRFKDGSYFFVNVHMDSGTAMISDICKALQ